MTMNPNNEFYVFEMCFPNNRFHEFEHFIHALILLLLLLFISGILKAFLIMNAIIYIAI